MRVYKAKTALVCQRHLHFQVSVNITAVQSKDQEEEIEWDSDGVEGGVWARAEEECCEQIERHEGALLIMSTVFGSYGVKMR